MLSITLYVVALSYYHYLNFLGYSALPFLDHSEVSNSTVFLVEGSAEKSLSKDGHSDAGLLVANRRNSHDSCLCYIDKLQPNKVHTRVLLCIGYQLK